MTTGLFSSGRDEKIIERLGAQLRGTKRNWSSFGITVAPIDSGAQLLDGFRLLSSLPNTTV